MLDDDHRSSRIRQAVEYAQQHLHIQRMQADGRLVKHENGVVLRFAHFACQFEPLCLAAGERRRILAQGQITEPEALKNRQLFKYLPVIPEHMHRVADGHAHQLRQGVCPVGFFGLPEDLLRLASISFAAAIRAGYGDIG